MQRCDSYDNYCNLFNVVLMGNVNMQVYFLAPADILPLQLHRYIDICTMYINLSLKSPFMLDDAVEHYALWRGLP